MALLCNTTPTQLSPLTPVPGSSKREDSHLGPPEALVPSSPEAYTQCLVLPAFIQFNCTWLEHLRLISLLHFPWLGYGWRPFSFAISLLFALDLLLLLGVGRDLPMKSGLAMMQLTRAATKEVLFFFDFHRPHHPLGPDHTFLGPAPGCRAQGAEEA